MTSKTHYKYLIISILCWILFITAIFPTFHSPLERGLQAVLYVVLAYQGWKNFKKFRKHYAD
nr:MAG TPA: DNA repair protein rad32, DNA double-strand break repair, Nuclease.2A [Caudoviricetes sp.]